MISTLENVSGQTQPVTLATIETLAKQFSDDHAALTAEVTALEKELFEVKERRLKAIREAVAKASQSKLALSNAVDGARHLFARPRTQIFHTVKVGLTKAKGKVTIPDEKLTLKRLESMFKDEAERGHYLHVKVALNKETLVELPAQDLKKLGVQVIDAGDAIVIKPTDSEIEKTVAALLKDAVEEEVAA